APGGVRRGLASPAGWPASFVAFAPSFAALIWIWYLHRELFRRYGLGDGPMVFLCRRAPLERNARLTRDVAQLIDNRHDKRDALAPSDLLRLALRISGDERPAGPRSWSCLPLRTNEIVDLTLELVRVD